MTDFATPTVLVTCFSTTCFLAFCWALKGHFHWHGHMPAGMRMLTAMSLVAFGSFLAGCSDGSLGSLWPCAIISFTGSLALFTWTLRATRRTRLTVAFSEDRPTFLLRKGPYRYVRHPFYSAYLLFWFGSAVASAGYASWAAAVAIAFVYWLASNQEEEKFSHSELAEAYAAYRAVTGRFIPCIPWIMRIPAISENAHV